MGMIYKVIPMRSLAVNPREETTWRRVELGPAPCQRNCSALFASIPRDEQLQWMKIFQQRVAQTKDATVKE